MQLCSAKRKHEDDDGEHNADRAGLRPRIDQDSGTEQDGAAALPLAGRPVKSDDESSPDDSDSGSDSSETYWEDSTSDESDEDSEEDDSEADEPERGIVIGQQPPGVVTSYSDPESGVTVLRAGSKPKIDMSFKQSSILSRVRAFLPELEAANKDLATADRKLELDDDEALDQPHVEMVRSDCH
jgi:hypothetical protein